MYLPNLSSLGPEKIDTNLGINCRDFPSLSSLSILFPFLEERERKLRSIDRETNEKGGRNSSEKRKGGWLRGMEWNGMIEIRSCAAGRVPSREHVVEMTSGASEAKRAAETETERKEESGRPAGGRRRNRSGPKSQRSLSDGDGRGGIEARADRSIGPRGRTRRARATKG
jgi:hypothetical protein